MPAAAVAHVPAALPARGALARWAFARTKRGRLRRYADAMGWHLTTDGVLVGDVEGIAIRAYEDRRHLAVIELAAPGLLPRMEVRPRTASTSQVGDGMREVRTGDSRFDAVYTLRAEDPWLARAIVDGTVRSSLISAPLQTVTASGERVVARSDAGLNPLDLLARGTALHVLLKAVPWEAYAERGRIPSQEAVQQVIRHRQMLPIEPLPSVGRRA